MSVGSTLGTPLGGNITVTVLNGIKCLVYELIYLIIGHHPTMSHTHVYHEEGFCIQILGELQHLVEAKTIAHVVVPVYAVVSRTFLNGTDGVLPFKAVGLAIAPLSLHIATTGEANERRMYGFKFLCQVNTTTILSILVGRWEKTHYVDGDFACLTTGQ